MDSKQPSQPPLNTAFKQDDNPAQTTDLEQLTGIQASKGSENSPQVDRRSAHDVESSHTNPPTSTALGAGERGPLVSRPLSNSTAETASSSELEGEQMRAPGEGDVADAVKNKADKGGFGEQKSLTADLDAKKAEHEEKLEKYGLLPQRDTDWIGSKEVDVQGALGGRGTAVVGVGESPD